MDTVDLGALAREIATAPAAPGSPQSRQRIALSRKLRAPRAGGCHPVKLDTLAFSSLRNTHDRPLGDPGDSSVPDGDPSPCVAFGLPDEIGRQLATAVIGLPQLAQQADLRLRRCPELGAGVGRRDLRHQVDRPLAVEEVRRSDAQDHRADQTTAVPDDALEQRPDIHGAAVGLALLAA